MAGARLNLTDARRELNGCIVVAALWLVPWAALSAATWLAGGRPSASPIGFIDPARIPQRLDSGRALSAWWRLVDPRAAVAPAVFWLSVAVVAAVVAAAIAAVRPVIARPRIAGLIDAAARGHGLHRVSRWATFGDLRPLRIRRPRPGAFAVGRIRWTQLATERETSVLVIGPTRSGKTSGLVIPNLFDWPGPAIATSTKSELVDITAGHRQARGPVHVYDPTGEMGERCRPVTWSPLTGCEDLDRAWTVASWLCAALQQGGARGDNDWAHWAESGKLLIAPLLFVAAVTGHTIVDVRTWIHGFDLATPIGLLEELLLDPATPSGSDPLRAMSMLASVDQRPERERGTVFSTVMRIFNVFNERSVAASASSSRFAADEFLVRRGTLFLCTPRQSPERVASLFVGLLMTVVTAAYAMSERLPGGRLESELGLFLDELANVVPVEDLPALASQGAGRGVMLMSIVQDVSQLRTRYGADRAHTILNNHGCKVVLPGISDPETSDLLSRLIGRSEYTDIQVSRGSDGRWSRSYSTRHDSMATPDSLRQLRAGSAIVIHRDRPPAVVRLCPWYRTRRFRRFARVPYFRNAEHVDRR